MSERWRSYFCNLNDKLASIALDLALRERAPMPDKHWLLWVWIYLRSATPNGLSSNAEFETLCSIEDKLTKHLGTTQAAIQVGRITTDGHREFYFYGQHARDLEATIGAVMKDFADYRFDLGSQEEPQWGQYFNVLYPSEEDMQRILNQDVIEVLEKHGDTLTPVRDIHHWIYFQSSSDRDAYASEVLEIGYKIEKELESTSNDCPFGLIITRDQAATPDQIDEAVIELFQMAKRRNAEYDGWEAALVAAKN